MKIVKHLTVFLLSLLTLVLLTSPLLADSEQKAVYDRAALFTQDEINALESRANELFSSLEYDIYIVTDKPSVSYESVSYYGDDFTSEYGIEGNSIILIITANRDNNYDLYTYGTAYSELSSSECNNILDNGDVYYNIKSGDYFEGAMAFIEVTHDEITLSIGELTAIAVIIALIAAIIFFVCVYVSYNKKMRSEKYPLERYAMLDLKETTDVFAGKFVTRRRIPRANSGGRSGGRSGGSRGGGHRGGR